MLSCRLCSQEITFSDMFVSQSGKKIPLDAETEQPHKCRVWLAQHTTYKKCSKGCGADIYWDEKQKSASGKFIPIDKKTGAPHQCPNDDYNTQQVVPIY